MSGGAQLSVTDLRRSTRHPVHLPVIGEHRRLGDVMLNIVNISTTGFMVRDTLDLGRGERVTIRLPQIGRIGVTKLSEPPPAMAPASQNQRYGCTREARLPRRFLYISSKVSAKYGWTPARTPSSAAFHTCSRVGK